MLIHFAKFGLRLSFYVVSGATTVCVVFFYSKKRQTFARQSTAKVLAWELILALPLFTGPTFLGQLCHISHMEGQRECAPILATCRLCPWQKWAPCRTVLPWRATRQRGELPYRENHMPHRQAQKIKRFFYCIFCLALFVYLSGTEKPNHAKELVTRWLTGWPPWRGDEWMDGWMVCLFASLEKFSPFFPSWPCVNFFCLLPDLDIIFKPL